MCAPRTGWDAHEVLKTLRRDLVRLEAEHGIHPELLFFTGDAAFGNVGERPGETLEDQFREAGAFLEGVRNAFRNPIPACNVFIVPGNHDVNRHAIFQEQTTWLDGQRDVEEVIALIQKGEARWQPYIARLASYRNFLQANYPHLLTDPERLLYAIAQEVAGIRIGVIGLNSAWSAGRNDERGKLWLAGRWQLGHLKPVISEADLSIALIHHPTSWFNQFEEPGLTREIKRSVDFHLHGHEHQAWVEQNTEGHVQIAAGAVYDRSNRESVYNIVQVDVTARSGTVWLRRYNSDAGDWGQFVIPKQTDQFGRWLLPKLRPPPAQDTVSRGTAPNRVSGRNSIWMKNGPEGTTRPTSLTQSFVLTPGQNTETILSDWVLNAPERSGKKLIRNLISPWVPGELCGSGYPLEPLLEDPQYQMDYKKAEEKSLAELGRTDAGWFAEAERWKVTLQTLRNFILQANPTVLAPEPFLLQLAGAWATRWFVTSREGPSADEQGISAEALLEIVRVLRISGLFIATGNAIDGFEIRPIAPAVSAYLDGFSLARGTHPPQKTQLVWSALLDTARSGRRMPAGARRPGSAVTSWLAVLTCVRLADPSNVGHLLDQISYQDFSMALDMYSLCDRKGNTKTNVDAVLRFVQEHGSSVPILFHCSFDLPGFQSIPLPGRTRAPNYPQAQLLLERLPDEDLLAVLLAACVHPPDTSLLDPELWQRVVPVEMRKSLRALGAELRADAVPVGNRVKVSRSVVTVQALMQPFPFIGRHHPSTELFARLPWLTALVIGFGCEARLPRMDELRRLMEMREVRDQILDSEEVPHASRKAGPWIGTNGSP